MGVLDFICKFAIQVNPISVFNLYFLVIFSIFSPNRAHLTYSIIKYIFTLIDLCVRHIFSYSLNHNISIKASLIKLS